MYPIDVINYIKIVDYMYMMCIYYIILYMYAYVNTVDAYMSIL